ncbi:MAG: MFS transporter [Syntrophus sp. (in: bacteria)]
MADHALNDKKSQFALIALAGSLAGVANLDYSLVNISIIPISKHFNVSTSLSDWVLIILGLISVATPVGFGKLGDLKGYRNVLNIGLIIYATGNIMCALAPSIQALIAFHTLKSIGYAMTLPMSLAITTVFLPSHMIGLALGVVAAMAALGFALGLAVGGYVAGVFGWQYNFLVSVPVLAAGLLASFIIVPVKQAEAPDARFDLPGSVWLFMALFPLIFALNSGAKAGWSNPLILTAFVISAIGFVLFFRQEQRISYPLVDLTLFKKRNFSYSIAAVALVYFLMGGVMFLFPFYLLLVRHLDMSQAGLVIMVFPITAAVVAPFAGSLADRFGSHLLCTTGMLITAAGNILVALLSADSGLAHVIAALCLMGVGIGLFFAPNNKLIMSLTPKEKQGMASGIYRMTTSAGSVLGIVFFVLVAQQVISIDCSRWHIAPSAYKLHPEILIHGFQVVFIIGTALMLLNAFFAFQAKDVGKTVGSAPHL